MTAKKVCPVCGEGYWNVGAHAEACRGPLVVPAARIPAAWLEWIAGRYEGDPGDEQADA